MERKDKKWFKRDIIVLISILILFVSISFLVNIGKEVSLPGVRIQYTVTLLLFVETNRVIVPDEIHGYEARSGQKLSVYMKYGEKADSCSIFATVCPNHFEMCPIRVVYG